MRVRNAALLNFEIARSFLFTLFVHEAKALLRPSSLKLGGVGVINDSEDRRILLVLLVNDSEYSDFTGQELI